MSINAQEQTQPITARHFILLVYPFKHALTGARRATILTKLRDLWQPWWRRFSTEGLEDILDDTYFFLPYVRELLFPETTRLPAGGTSQKLARAAELAKLTPEQVARQLSTEAVLRVSYSSDRLAALQPLSLEAEDEESFAAPVNLCWVDAILFPQQIGFLILKLELTSESPKTAYVNEFLYHARLIHPPHARWRLPSWKRRPHPVPLAFQGRELVEFLLQGLVDENDQPLLAFDDFLAKTREASWSRYTDSDFAQVYGQVFRIFSYACLAGSPQSESETTSEESDRLVSHTGEALVSRKGSDLFASDSQRCLYELATCTDTRIPTYVPVRGYLSSLFDRGLMAFWRNWQGLALQDNVAFLGLHKSPFTLKVLAHNVEYDYFHLYLLTLFQKMWLSIMLGELVRREANLACNHRQARKLWDAFIMFENRYWFTEVTAKPLGTEIYHRYQQGMNVLPLYEEFQRQAQKLQEYYEHKTASSTNSLLNFLTLIGLPAGLTVGLFSNALIRNVSWNHFFLTGVAMYTVVLVLWFVFRTLARK